MKIAPCKGCLDRTTNCHAKCKRYLAYVTENARVNKERAKLSAIEELVIVTAARRKKKYGGRR